MNRINEVMRKQVDAGHIDAAITIVARREKVVVHFSTHGQMDVKKGRVMEPDAITRMASSSKPVLAGSRPEPKSWSDRCAIAGEGIAQVFEGWNAGAVFRDSGTDEYASFDVKVGMHKRRHAIEGGWIVELIPIGCSCNRFRPIRISQIG